MTPEEYAAMYQQVYGTSAFESNSYLHFDEDSVPDYVGPETVNAYRDFEGAIRFMDSDYLVQDAFYSPTSPSPVDFTVIGNLDDEEIGFDAPEFVHGFPFPPSLADEVLKEIQVDVLPTVSTFSEGNQVHVATPETVRSCPCFNLQLYHGVDPSLASSHTCEDCSWCLAAPKLRFSQFLAFAGGTVYFSHPRVLKTSYPKKRIRDNAYTFVPFSICSVPILRQMKGRKRMPFGVSYNATSVVDWYSGRNRDVVTSPLSAFERCCSTKHPPPYSSQVPNDSVDATASTLALRASATSPASASDNPSHPARTARQSTQF